MAANEPQLDLLDAEDFANPDNDARSIMAEILAAKPGATISTDDATADYQGVSSARPQDDAIEPPPAAKKPPPIKEYAAARQVANDNPLPLAACADRIYELTDQGWVDVSSRVRAQLNCIMQKHAPGAYRCMIDQMQIPCPHDAMEPSIYLLRSPGCTNWTPIWQQATLQPQDIVFLDQVYDAVTNQSRPLPGVLWGPRVDAKAALSDLALADPDYLQAEEVFLSTLNFAFPDPATRNHFQEVMSTLLQPHYHLRHVITLWGVPFSAKTTLANACAVAPGGVRGASFVQESSLVRDKWATIMLQHKFANVSHDSARTPRWTPFFKDYTGGSMVVESKGFAPYSVIPTAKLISTCNEMQDLADSSGATAQRLLAFRFDHARPNHHSPAQNDLMLPSFWASLPRRSAIITWMLEGSERLHTRKHFSPPKDADEQLHAAMSDADPARRILFDLLEEDRSAFTPTALIAQHLPPNVSANRLTEYMRQLFPRATKDRVKVDGGPRQHGYRGVKLA